MGWLERVMDPYEKSGRVAVTRDEPTKFAQWRYTSAGIRHLLRYLEAYCSVVSLIFVGTTSLAGYVGQN